MVEDEFIDEKKETMNLSVENPHKQQSLSQNFENPEQQETTHNSPESQEAPLEEQTSQASTDAPNTVQEDAQQKEEKKQIPDLTGLTEEDLFKKPEQKLELKNKLKALLFASGKPLTLDELTRLVRKRDKRPVLYCLRLLQEEYNTTTDEPLILLDDQQWSWRLTLKERYVPVVEKIVTQTELPKSVIETLAVIAWKAPVTQSEVIHVRTNKAYQHIKDLEEAGYITTEKFGRTRLIKLTQKFFDYFDISREQLQREIQAMLPQKKAAIHQAVKEKGEDVYEEQEDVPETEYQEHDVGKEKNHDDAPFDDEQKQTVQSSEISQETQSH